MIVILDFGSQYTQLIARRVREAQVYCEILPGNCAIDEVISRQPKGIILSGGPASVFEKGAPKPDKRLWELGIPKLGICYGLQLIAQHWQGKIQPSRYREYGLARLKITDPKNPLLADLTAEITVWMSHGDALTHLPPGFKIIARTESAPQAALANPDQNVYGVQFHPEVKHTPQGMTILKNFIFRICQENPTWTMKSFIEQEIKSIRARVGKKKVICALSGGVDSSVSATLVKRAIGKQLYCIFVDHGVLRWGEKERVKRIFGPIFGSRLFFINAQKEFLDKLTGVSDPEQKRKIIGRKFISVFERVAGSIGQIDFLVQGTLYPDVIESVSVKGPAATIKSHHNVGGLPKRMRLKLIEPLRFLFKDEVRQLGRELGLPEELLSRHPFPGPGLAVRILGPVDKQKLSLLREADRRVEEEIRKAGLYKKIWQAFAVLLPVRSVGVMGDRRSYEYPVVLRIVESSDGMTADWARLPFDVLGRIASRIVNEVKGINRVVYDITSKPPATIEWE